MNMNEWSVPAQLEYVILNFPHNLQNEHFDEFTELESAWQQWLRENNN